jgi:hypothetical protein
VESTVKESLMPLRGNQGESVESGASTGRKGAKVPVMCQESPMIFNWAMSFGLPAATRPSLKIRDKSGEEKYSTFEKKSAVPCR